MLIVAGVLLCGINMRMNIQIIKLQSAKFSVSIQSSPCSLLHLHPDLVLPVSCVIHCSRPLLGFPAPISISHSVSHIQPE